MLSHLTDPAADVKTHKLFWPVEPRSDSI